MIEVGIPFSDPVADGPVIQAAAQRALDAGVRVGDCFDLIAAFRARHRDVPVGILTYANLVVARGRLHARRGRGRRRQPADRRRARARGGAVRARDGAGGHRAGADRRRQHARRRRSRGSQAFRKLTLIASAEPGITGTHAGGEFDRGTDRAARRRRALRRRFSASEFRRPSTSARRSTPGAAGVICGSAIVDSRPAAETSSASSDSLKALRHGTTRRRNELNPP